MKVSAEGALTGIGLTFAATVLVPMLRSVTRPVVQGSQAGLVTAGLEVQKRLSYAGSMLKEEMEDFMAEVEFERFKKRIDLEIGSDEFKE